MLFPTATFAIFFLIVLPLSWLRCRRCTAGGRSSSSRATCSTAGGTGGSSSCSRAARSGTRCSPVRIHRATAAVAAEGAALARPRRQPRRARLLQVLRLLRRLERQHRSRSSASTARRRCARSSSRSASRSTRSWRSATSSTRIAATSCRRRSRSSRSTSPSSRTSSPGRSSGPAELIPQLDDAPRPPPGRHEPRLLPDRDRPVQEGRDRELPRLAHRRPGVRRAGAALVARDPDRDLRVRGPDLRRLLRLHRHRDRASRSCSGSRSRRTSTRPTPPRSLQDFWRRWHMTLSRWLRDYLYIPLGGNRKGTLVTYRNLMLTMLIGGLWHGAAWTFVVWGGIHGVGLAIERWRKRAARLRRARADTRRRRIVARLVTFNVVCLAWVFFRADSFATRLGHADRALHRLGRGLAARHRRRAARDRGRDRLAVPSGPVPVRGDGRASAGCRWSARRVVLAFALMLTNTMGPRAWHPSSTSASDDDAFRPTSHPPRRRSAAIALRAARRGSETTDAASRPRATRSSCARSLSCSPLC